MATDVKTQIAETFIKHAKNVGMDKVTINAIVSECSISRQAFYYYFQDIVDVARYVLREKLRLTLDSGEEVNDPQKAVYLFAEDLTKQFPVISITLNSKLRGEMELLMIKELKNFFFIIFSHQDCGRDLTKKQIDFQSDLIACGICAYSIEHCNDVNFNTEEFSMMLWDMLKRTYN